MPKNSFNAGKCRKIPLMQKTSEKFHLCFVIQKCAFNSKNAEKYRKISLMQENAEKFH
jgi:hypothetical protein